MTDETVGERLPKPADEKPALPAADDQPVNFAAPPAPPDNRAVILAEAEAIATYIARHGDVLTPKEPATGPNSDKRRELYTELLKAAGAAKEAFEQEDSLAKADDAANAKWQKLMEAYASITAFTFAERGVNGRTVLDTQGRTVDGPGIIPGKQSPRSTPLKVGLILFILALVLELAAAWAGSISTTERGVSQSDADGLNFFQLLIYHPTIVLAPFLIPAAWGGIGSCVFLAKRLTDLLAELAYEESRVKGTRTRIFLGAMLGVIVVVLFFPDFNSSIRVGTVNFAPATAAFIGGLGVKPVYAAFEALAVGLANRVSGKEKSGK